MSEIVKTTRSRAHGVLFLCSIDFSESFSSENVYGQLGMQVNILLCIYSVFKYIHKCGQVCKLYIYVYIE
jgi:hypothetical protein